MFIEFQFSTQLFARIVRNRIRALDLCLDAASGGQVIDKVVPKASTILQRETRLESNGGLRTEVPASTLIVWVFSPKNLYNFTTRYLQLVQEFEIFLVSDADLASNGVSPTPSTPTSVRVAFNIELSSTNQIQGGGPATLLYKFAWAHFGVLDPFLPASQRDQLEAMIANISLTPTTLDLSPLGDLAGGPMQAINCGIVLSADGASVAMRVDFEVEETMPAVSSDFFNVGPPNILQGQEWAVLLDKDLLIASAHKRIRDGLAGQAKAKPKWGPEVVWEPAAPRIRVNVGAEILGACPFFVKDIDLDVELEVTMGFAIASPTELAVRFHVQAEASDTAELIGCAVVPALVWPFGGPLVLDELKSDSAMGDYFAGMLLGLPMICGMFASAVGTMAAKSLSTGSFGPNCVKHGDSDVECIYPLVINVGVPAFPIRLQGGQVRGSSAGLILCGPAQVREVPDETVTVTTSPLEWTITGGCRGGFRFINQAQIAVASSGDRGGLCSARMLDDLLGEFAVTVDRADNLVTVVALGVPAYLALPVKYPCKVRVVTTAGVRTITYPPPSALSAQRQQELEVIKHNFESVCQAWKDTFHEIEWGGWGPPKPTDGPDWQQHWEVAIHDLRPGEWVDVLTDANVQVLSAKASADGVAHFGAVFDGPSGPVALRIGRRGEPPFEKTPKLTPLQMVLAHRLSIPTEGRSVAMHFEGPEGDRRLTIEDDKSTRVFALGARAVNGLVQASAYVGERRISRASHRGRRLASTPSDHALKALRSIEANDSLAPSMGEPRVGGVALPLFVRTRTRAALFDLAGPNGQPDLVQLYAGQAWFENTALGGAWVARWSEDASIARLYQVVARRTDQQVLRRIAGPLGV